jgi:hypothetical protein
MPNEATKFDLPDDYLQEIGKIAVSWNDLENLLHHTLVLALLDDFAQDGRAIAAFAHIAFPQKLDTLKTMLQMGNTSGGKVFSDYCEQIQPLLKNCQEKRNAILHQSWSVQDGTVKRLDIKARGVLRLTLSDVTLDELKGITALIIRTHQSMFELIAMPLSPKSAPQQGQ